MIKKVIVKKYVPVRMPLEAYKNYVKRQEKIERTIKKITKKTVRIPLTRIFEISSENPINLADKEVVKKSQK